MKGLTSNENNTAREALSSRKQELRLLVETIPALMGRTGPEGNAEFVAQLQAILNVLPAYTWYSDPSGGLTFVNKRTAEYLGFPEDHPLRFGVDIGASWDDWVTLLHPDDQEDARKYRLDSLRTGEAGEHSYRVRSVQGDYRWFLTRFEPLRASDGTLLLWVGATLDIEELKQAEQELRESEYKLRQITETVPGLLWSNGPDGEPTHINQRMLDYSGMRFEDFKLRGWEAFVHPADFPETVQAFYHAIQTGTSYQGMMRLRRVDGEFRWHHARCEPLRDRQERIIQWYGLSVDIDERKKAQDRLRRSEAYLAEAQHLSHTGSFGWTPSTGELHWSDETFRILEYDPSVEPTIERVLQRIHPDDRAMMRQLLDETSRGEKDFDVTHRLSMPDGSVKFVHVLSHALKDATGNLEIVGALMDVTENTLLYRDLAEREARLAERTEALHRSEGYLAEAHRLSHTGTWVFNATTMAYVYWSDESYRIWGFDPLEGIPNREAIRRRIHPDDRDRVYEQGEKAVREKRDYAVAYRIVLPDGAIKYLEANSRHLFSARGELVEVLGTHVDVTERKRAEDRLRRGEAYLAEAQHLSHTGSFGWTPSTGELHWSDETFRILEYDPSVEPTIERVLQRIHPDDRAMMRQLLDETSRGEKDFDVTHRLSMPDGSVKFVHVLSHALKDATGNLEIVGALMDVTENTLLYRDLAEREARLVERTKALSRSEAYLAEAQRLSHTGTLVLNTTTNQYLYWSDESYQIWALDPLQGLPSRQTVWQRFHPDDRDRIWQEIQEALRQKKDYSGEFRILLPNGTVKYVAATGHHRFSTSGEPVEFIGTNVDVTERKHAEQALRGSEAKFRDYAETASDWFWETGPDYKFTLLTENAFGSNAADRFGTACWDHALDLETEPEKWRLLRATLDSREPFRDFVYRGLDGNGSPMYVRASGKPVFDADGEFRGYRGTGTDVTEHKRAEEGLRRGEAWLTQAQRLSHTGNWVYNATTMRYLYWSDESYRIWGFDPLQGLPSRENMWGRIHPDDRDRAWEEVQEALRQKRDFACEFRILLPDGTIKYLEATTHHVFSSGGALVEAVSTHVDVTERKRAQAEHEKLRQLESDLARMNRLSMMGELAASLAHEIAQPIATARNNARASMHFLDRSPPDLSQVGEALACVVDDADRAGDILDRIRDHIKKAPPRKERVDLNHAITEVIGLAQSAIVKNGASIQTRLTEGLSDVQADRVQLQQVVLNLILNAVEAMGAIEEGVRELSISTKQHEAGGVLVAVHDSGPGIDPEHLDRVFDAFYTTKSSGVGMGLSICRSIIHAHGGRLWADVNTPRGAVFRFTLPGADNELTNSFRPAQLTRESCEDTVSDTARQPAYEGNKPPHR